MPNYFTLANAIGFYSSGRDVSDQNVLKKLLYLLLESEFAKHSGMTDQDSDNGTSLSAKRELQFPIS